MLYYYFICSFSVLLVYKVHKSKMWTNITLINNFNKQHYRPDERKYWILFYKSWTQCFIIILEILFSFF